MQQNITLLDSELVGEILIRISIISRLLGHDTISGTVRDYLDPHKEGKTPEHQFVYDMLLDDNPCSQELAVEIAGVLDLPELPVN